MRFFLLFVFLLSAPYVHDRTNVLSQKEQQFLNERLKELDEQEGVSLVVVVIQSLLDKPIEDVAQYYVNHLQVGHKGRSRGILLLLATEQKRSFIDLGYGLDGDIDPPAATIICQQSIDPLLQKGQVEAAVVGGIQAILHLFGKTLDREESPTVLRAWYHMSVYLFVISVILLFFVARLAPTKLWWLSPLIGLGIGSTQSFGLACALMALGICMVMICFLIRQYYKL